jgi:hypothetical protein
MRTKTMLVSALLGAIGSVSVMAQTNVYSLNVVGYVQIQLQPGFNIISCPLITSPDNTLGSVLPNTNGQFAGCSLTFFSPTLGPSLVSATSTAHGDHSGWTPAGSASSIIIAPGSALWFYNGFTTNITNTLVGTVTNGLATNTIQPGFNLVSSMVPMSGDIYSNVLCGNDGVHGFTNVNNGDEVSVYDPTPNGSGGQNGYVAGQGGVYLTTTPSHANNGGSPWKLASGGDPIVYYVGEGFFYYNSTSSSTPIQWVENYTQTQP